MLQSNSTILSALGLTAAFVCGTSASAAVLSGSFTSISSATIDVDDEGTLDWAVWAPASDPTDGAPTASKSGGVAISDATNNDGWNDAGGSAGVDYTYGMTTATNRGLATAFDSTGAYLEIQVTGDPTQDYELRVYTAAFRANLDITASLNNASTYTIDDALVVGADSSKPAGVLSLIFRPDSVSDLLTVRLEQQNTTGDNSHVLLEAATLAPVPEPASLALVAAGGVLIGTGRRGKHA